MLPCWKDLMEQKNVKVRNNYIGITESADEIFEKTMSIPDEIMIKLFNLSYENHC